MYTLFAQLLSKLLPLEFYVKIRHFKKIGRWPNVNKPKSFNEKIIHRLLKTNDQRFADLSDKIKVREYVANKVGEHILIPLLGVYDRIEPKDVLEINDKCVLKNNNNSGGVYIYSKGKSGNLDDICNNLNANKEKAYGKYKGEYWYKNIKPKILIEKFIGNDDGTPPVDYKLHMFNQGNGEFSILIQIMYDRITSTNSTLYDEHLKVLPFSLRSPNNNIAAPELKQLEEMKNIAKKLAAGFDYIRVDLYLVNNEILFGELTFAPNSGAGKFTPDSFDFWMGEMWYGIE